MIKIKIYETKDVFTIGIACIHKKIKCRLAQSCSYLKSKALSIENYYSNFSCLIENHDARETRFQGSFLDQSITNNGFRTVQSIICQGFKPIRLKIYIIVNPIKLIKLQKINHFDNALLKNDQK